MLCKNSYCGISRGARLVATFCVALSLASTGCRSGKSSATNLFGFNREPSAEALAGSGPTTTYPAPPSDSATPEAIASIAGGTVQPSTSPIKSPKASGTQFASNAGAPSYVSPASSNSGASSTGPNMAAAQANGIYGKTQPAGFAAPSQNAPANNLAAAKPGSMNSPNIQIPEMKVPQVKPVSLQMPSGSGSNYAASIPSGYQFGSENPNTAGSSATAAKAPSAYSIPNMNLPSNSVASSSSKPTTSTVGFSMPGSMDSATKTPTTPAEPNQGITATFSDSNPQSNHSVGDLAASKETPQASQPAARISAVNYMPGSTASSSGYPGASDSYPNSSTSGSYFR